MSKGEISLDYPPPEDPPKVLNPPDEIYLVYGDLDQDAEHAECHEVTWCRDGQFCCDVRYVRSDIYYEAMSRAHRLLGAVLRVAEHPSSHQSAWGKELLAEMAKHDALMRIILP
jgi:hypothetical protein